MSNCELKREFDYPDEPEYPVWVGYFDHKPTVEECHEAYGSPPDCAIQEIEDVDKYGAWRDDTFRIVLGPIV